MSIDTKIERVQLLMSPWIWLFLWPADVMRPGICWILFQWRHDIPGKGRKLNYRKHNNIKSSLHTCISHQYLLRWLYFVVQSQKAVSAFIYK